MRNDTSPRSSLRLGFALAPSGLLALLSGCSPATMVEQPIDLEALKVGLSDAARVDYQGDGDGGLSHVNFYSIKAGTPEHAALSMLDQAKLAKVQSSVLHSAKLKPTELIAGTEVTGTLSMTDAGGERQQEIVLKLPKQWNGQLVVAGTPGTRSEFANDAILVPWLLRRGYAYVAGNKGMTNKNADGNTTLLNKLHPTQHWGVMMHDLAAWSSARLKAATGKAPKYVYAVGLSNGGYQVRRALEIDHQKAAQSLPRSFAGGIEWAGAYWPDSRVLDKDRDGTVTPAEYAAATQLVSSNERAAVAIGYLYDPGSLANPASYGESPAFSKAQPAMRAAGFAPESAVLWGTYAMLFDSLKAALPAFKGVGYYNLTAYYYRADLLGHDAKDSAAYSMWAPMAGGRPPFYDYVTTQPDGGYTKESVGWALKNANTAEFSVPLISLHGDRDALIGLPGHGTAYADAVKAYGTAAMHRLYVIQNGNHVDAHADGTLDYDCNGKPGDEGAGDLLTPMQPYVERAFDVLTDWVERNQAPSSSHTVTTDPKNDVLDAKQIKL